MVYRGITFRDNPPASDAAIKEYEQWFGASFPKPYADFLRTVNGGRPKPSTISYTGRKSGKLRTQRVEYFFGIRRCEYSLKWAFENFVDTGRLPTGCLPFAFLKYGAIFYIQMKDRHVFLWDPEVEGDPSNNALVAESFDKFLDSFHEDEAE
jgi:hypothetical protein